MLNNLKDELHDVLSGKSEIRFGKTIQTVASYLSDGEKTSATFEDKKHFKTKEAKRLDILHKIKFLGLNQIQ
jgi:uncharacterized protein YcbK (DUF882 family)